MTWPTGGPPNNNYGKNWVDLLQPPDYAGKINYGKFRALPKMIEKKVKITSRKILNPYGENPNYGKNGDWRAPV